MEETIRVQKYIAQSGHCSRRRAEVLIQDGRVKINGEIVRDFGIKINPLKDIVEVEGNILKPEEKKVYIVLNKPVGYVSSCSHKGKKIILDLVNVPERIYPVGRLDEYSRGLIILTNDGPLHNRLSHPSFDHEKEYIVRTNIPLSNKELNLLSKGVIIDGRRTRSAIVKKRGKDSYTFILKEGRNRQIRKMIQSLSKKVVDLKRIKMASISLGGLSQGKWRHLSHNEVNRLKKIAGI